MKDKRGPFFIFMTILMASIFISISTPVTAQAISPIPSRTDPGNATFALADLTGIGDIVLSGSSPSYNFYVPIPAEWKISGMRLHLNISHSEVLRANSTLTLQINHMPIESLPLTSNNNGPYPWDVSVPPEMLKGENIIVGLIGFMRVSDLVCDDIENAANWTRIASQSTVDFSYDSAPLSLNLNQFPYPFIRPRSLTADQVAVITPDNATSEEMSAVFDVANSLGTLETWHGLNLSTLQAMQLTNDIKTKYDAIMIGTIDRLKLFAFGVTWSLRIDSTGKLITPDNTYVPDDAGVIMIAQSPWNPEKAVMAVTGFTQAAVTNAALAMRHSQFANLVRGQYAIIPSLPEDKAASNGGPDWTNTDLAALGYSDQTVNGIGKQRISIPLNLPNGIRPQAVQVKLIFSHAPFVSTDRSYIVLSANGIPQEGLLLTSANEKKGEWTVTIPSDQLIPGKNKLEVLFDLHMRENEICTDNYFDKAWGVLHPESTIQASFEDTAVQPDLINYPSSYGKDTIVIVSPDMGGEERNGTFQLVSQLGALLGKKAPVFRIAASSQLASADLKGHSLILIGLPDKNLLLAEGLLSAPIQLEGPARTLKTRLFNLTVEDGQPVGLIQEIISPWDPTRISLLITGSNDKGIGWATGLLSNPTMIRRLRGNVAMIDEVGGLTLINSYEPEKSVSPITISHNENTGPSERTFWITLVGVLIFSIIVLFFILIRRRMALH
jgi:hypothetical protein